MFLGRAAHHTAVSSSYWAFFSQKANELGSCILTRKVTSFYGSELVAVVWGGKAVGKHPALHPMALSSLVQLLFPESPWWFPSSTHLFSCAEETLQIRYCIIYLPFCSILGPINPEFKETIGIENHLWVLPSPLDLGSSPVKKPRQAQLFCHFSICIFKFLCH